MSDKQKFLRLFTRNTNEELKNFAQSLILSHQDLVCFLDTLDKTSSGKLVKTLQSDILEYQVTYFKKYEAFPDKSDLIEEFKNRQNRSVIESKAVIDLIDSIYENEVTLEDVKTAYKVVLNSYKKNLAVKSVLSVLDEDDADDILESVITDFSKIKNDYSKEDKPIVGLADFISQKLQQVEERGSFAKSCAIYGYRTMDQVIGGFFPGEIVMIAGAPATGKSFVLQNTFCANLEKGIEVVYASNEVSEDQFWARIISRYTQIPLDKLRHSLLTEEEEELFFEVADSLKEKFKNRGAFVGLSGAKSVNALKSAIESYYPNEKPKLILLDHPQLMRETTRPNMQDWDNSAEVMLGMKRLALEWNCAFFCPVHFNRQGNRGPADISNVKYQTFIEKADTIYVMQMSEDSPYQPPEPGSYEGTPGIIEVRTGRARNAATGQLFNLAIDFSRASVSDAGEVFTRSESVISRLASREDAIRQEISNME